MLIRLRQTVFQISLISEKLLGNVVSKKIEAAESIASEFAAAEKSSGKTGEQGAKGKLLGFFGKVTFRDLLSQYASSDKPLIDNEIKTLKSVLPRP